MGDLADLSLDEHVRTQHHASLLGVQPRHPLPDRWLPMSGGRMLSTASQPQHGARVASLLKGQAGTRRSGVLAHGPSSSRPTCLGIPAPGPLACVLAQPAPFSSPASQPIGRAGLSVAWRAHSLQRVGDAGIPGVRWWKGIAAMSKYAVFFTLKGEAIARAMEQPSDRVVVVSKAVESAGGKLEAYYLMFGQYDGFVIVDLPDSRAAAATSLAVSSTGAFEHLETHELIEAEDLNPILEQAKGITSQLPGT